ncbi:MAG: UDP-N-acetylglucosamine diphosphorylase [Oscillospiraceae bacterium]|nr:UDP-N-acetylglucosamine diphosphorylase [Oscillospiraceae bacterium]
MDTTGELNTMTEQSRDAILDRHRKNGVAIPISDGIIIGRDVIIGQGTLILPGTIIRGRSTIGAGCEIGPNSYLDNAVVGANCTVRSSQIDSSRIGDNVKIGPMSNIRPDCVVKSGAKVGDFVELKNAVIGAGTSVAHLTYMGDCDVGDNVNIGCGVVTVNYDGKKKYRTVVGDGAFIGCNTNLIAPVKVGERAYSAAGTTITEDVPEDALVIGRARQLVKHGWAKRRVNS